MALSRSEIVKKAWLKRRATFIPPMKGKKMSAESRRKMSKAAKSRPSNHLGKKHSLETRAKISKRVRKAALRGKNCPAYIDGRHSLRQEERSSPKAKRWAYDVKARDGFCCVHCGDDRGGNLHSHHINHWADCPDLRFEISNGVTLCRQCHWLVHAYNLSLWSVAA